MSWISRTPPTAEQKELNRLRRDIHSLNININTLQQKERDIRRQYIMTMTNEDPDSVIDQANTDILESQLTNLRIDIELILEDLAELTEAYEALSNRLLSNRK